MEKGDLHWERLSAGEYHTLYYANGYRYYVTKIHTRRIAWRVTYVWDKQKNKNDRRKLHGYSSSFDTLKAAKRAAYAHNMNPRKKYKFIGRNTQEMVGHPADSPYKYASERWNFMRFREVPKNNKIDVRYLTVHTINPVKFFQPDQAKINEEIKLVAEGKLIGSSPERLMELLEKYRAADGSVIIPNGRSLPSRIA